VVRVLVAVVAVALVVVGEEVLEVAMKTNIKDSDRATDMDQAVDSVEVDLETVVAVVLVVGEDLDHHVVDVADLAGMLPVFLF